MAWLSTHVGADGKTCYYLRRRVDGKVVTEPLGPVTEADARATLKAVEEGAAPRKVEATSDVLTAFYKSMKAVKRSPRTVAFYEEKLTAVANALAPAPIASWRRFDLEAYLAKKIEGGWSASTASKTVRACRTFVRWAEAAGLDVPDFTKGIKTPRGRPVETHAYSAAELTAILAASVGTKLELPVHLAALAGLPLGDLRAITWAEIDWRRGRILKTRVKTGERIDVPMTTGLKEVLKRHRATHGIVCRDLPENDGDLRQALHRVLKRAGIDSADRHGWHAIRKSFATLMAANGADVATIGALLGHRAGSPVTLKYIAPSQSRKVDAISRLEVPPHHGMPI